MRCRDISNFHEAARLKIDCGTDRTMYGTYNENAFNVLFHFSNKDDAEADSLYCLFINASPYQHCESNGAYFFEPMRAGNTVSIIIPDPKILDGEHVFSIECISETMALKDVLLPDTLTYDVCPTEDIKLVIDYNDDAGFFYADI